MGTLASAHLDPGVVEQQLEKVLASSQFVETTRLNRFLQYLVQQSLAGNSAALKGYSIGVDVFDKPDDFDPSIDTIVRVQAGKLRSRLDLYYASEGRDDPLRIIVPKGSYAPVFEVAFDPESTLEEASGATAPGNQAGKQEAFEKYSVAVLPFDNLSGDREQEFLADGLTEEILNALARFRELRVISRHSTFRYKDKAVDPREIGLELGVRYMLIGSIRRWGDQVRVTAQLTETTSGTQLTSEVYDRDISAKNLIEIQEDIASRIAAEIAEPHGVIHRTGSRNRVETEDLDAYECRLLASQYWRAPTSETHARVRGLLERAVTIDPMYSGAWAMLAIIYGDEVRGRYNYNPEPPPLDRAMDAAKRAVDLDPLNAAGYHALFMTHFNRSEISAYETAAEKALALNANYPDLIADYGVCKAFLGEWEEGHDYVQRAMELSPHPPGWYRAFLAVFHYVHERYDEALAHTEAVTLGAFHWGNLIRAMIHAQLGNDDAARSAAQAALSEVPDFEQTASVALQIWNFRDEDTKLLVDGWRKAGLNVQVET